MANLWNSEPDSENHHASGLQTIQPQAKIKKKKSACSMPHLKRVGKNALQKRHDEKISVISA